jgi:hypothetical protein
MEDQRATIIEELATVSSHVAEARIRLDKMDFDFKAELRDLKANALEQSKTLIHISGAVEQTFDDNIKRLEALERKVG